MLNGLDLFTGSAGLTNALEPYVRPVAYCEVDRYPQSAILSLMAAGKIPIAPIWDDVRSFNGALLGGRPIDIIYGGFPCQDLSLAGHRKGLEGEKSKLFWQVVRLTNDLKPRWVFLENVPGILTWIDEIVEAFRDIGYILEPDDYGILRAWEVGANHIRDRWWALAYPDSEQYQGGSHAERWETAENLLANAASKRWGTRSDNSNRGNQAQGRERSSEPSGSGGRVIEVFSDAGGEGLQIPEFGGKPTAPQHQFFSGATASEPDWWAVEPGICRVAHGISGRVGQIKCYGNGVVPLKARTAFEILMGLKS